MSSQYGVVLFDSTQRAIQAERVLKAAGLAVKLIPVPRQISSDCGVCLRFLWQDHSRVEEVLREHRIAFAGIREL